MSKPRIGLLLGEVRPEAGIHALDLLRLAADAAAGREPGAVVLAGLPFPAATPARGAAFDIVGQGVADPEPISRVFHMAVSPAGGRA